MLALVADEVVERNGLGADEAALEIAVDDARRLRGGVADVNRPGAHFLDAGGEVGLQAQQAESRADQPVQARLALAHFFQEKRLVFVAHVGHVGFHLGADGHHGSILAGGVFLQARQQRVVFKAVFADVAHEHGGLGGDEAQRLEARLVFGRERQGAHGAAFVQGGLHRLQQPEHGGGFLVVAAFAGFGVALHGFFDRAQIGQAQLGLDDFDVGNGIDLAGHVNHVGVFKAAHHVHDGVCLADVRQKLVAQPFALAGAGHQPGDVHEFDDGGHHALGLDHLGQLFQARVGHFHHAGVGFDGAKRVVLGGNARPGQRVEKSGLAHVGQAHDAALEAHEGVQ